MQYIKQQNVVLNATNAVQNATKCKTLSNESQYRTQNMQYIKQQNALQNATKCSA